MAHCEAVHPLNDRLRGGLAVALLGVRIYYMRRGNGAVLRLGFPNDRLQGCSFAMLSEMLNGGLKDCAKC